MKSPLYTRTGDSGTTSLVGGSRVAKDDARLEAYGTLDELNSHIGLILSAATLTPDDRKALLLIQSMLFHAGTILATEQQSKWQPEPLPTDGLEALESEIDRVDASVPPMRSFILPGGTSAAAMTHVARTVARRAERRIVALQNTLPDGGGDKIAACARYVNRLSDYLFALARALNARGGVADTPWKMP